MIRTAADVSSVLASVTIIFAIFTYLREVRGPNHEAAKALHGSPAVARPR